MKRNMFTIPASDSIGSEAEARDFAIEWQQWASETALSYQELYEWQTFFRLLAHKFGMLEEFKEEGIL